MTTETPTPRKTPKKKASKARIDSPVSVRWTLAELPSSQHKAGLAGLALCVKYLERRKHAGVCKLESLEPGALTLLVDGAGMQSLFDDVYAASLEEQEYDKPFQNKRTKEDVEPKRTFQKKVTDKKGVEKTKTVYVYEQTVPRGGLVEEWDAAPSGAQKLWLKLWRDVVWRTLRGVPATRDAYERRASKEEATDGLDAWESLATQPTDSVPLPSHFYLGAQTTTAENVSFCDAAKTQLLLHFWPFAVPIYVPETVDREGERDFVGHALVVPDIVDLEGFVADWAKLARARGTEPSGYVPRDAVVSLPGEAGLDLALRATQMVSEREGTTLTQPWLVAVDVFHLEKDGNNVRIRSVGRLDLSRKTVDLYGRVKSQYWSHDFRRQRVLNIIEGRAWWAGFGRLCSTTSEAQTIKNSNFRRDCRIAFTEVEMTQEETEDPKTLEHRIYRMVRSFVSQRLVVKYGDDWKWDRVKGTDREKEYREKREKVAREAFLAVRSRTGGDFVGYFTSTICSVPQHLGEAGFVEVARALHDSSQVEQVRSLTLLALSANS